MRAAERGARAQGAGARLGYTGNVIRWACMGRVWAALQSIARKALNRIEIAAKLEAMRRRDRGGGRGGEERGQAVKLAPAIAVKF